MRTLETNDIATLYYSASSHILVLAGNEIKISHYHPPRWFRNNKNGKYSHAKHTHVVQPVPRGPADFLSVPP